MAMHWISFFVVLNLLLVQLSLPCSLTCGNKLGMHVTSYSCSQQAEAINGMLTLNQMSEISPKVCVGKCYLEPFCSLAVWSSSATTDNCLLMSRFYGNKVDPLPFSLADSACEAYHQNHIRCKNCGESRKTVCRCPAKFFGHHCELESPSNCGFRQWAGVHISNHLYLQTFHLPHTMVIPLPQSVQSLHSLNTLHIISGTLYSLQAEPLMAVDPDVQDFVDPPLMEFLLCGSSKVVTERLLLNGTRWSIETATPTPTCAVMTHYTVKGMFVGNPNDIITGLSNGHLLLSRGLANVVFEAGSESTAVASKLIVSETNPHTTGFLTPQLFESHKHFMSDDLKSSVKYHFGQPVHEASNSSLTRSWTLDHCFYSFTGSSSSSLTDILADAVVSGRQIRVLWNVHSNTWISSDVIQVVSTQEDFVVEIVPLLSQIDARTPMGMNTSVLPTALSTSGTRAQCHRQLNAPDPLWRDHAPFQNVVKWYIGHRTFTKLLEVENGGAIIEGSKDELVNKVGSFDSRVCIRFDLPRKMTSCFSAGRIFRRKGTSHKLVLFQTRAFHVMGFDDQGGFSGFVDPLCSSRELLISMDGWIKAIDYAIGTVDATVVDITDFKSVSWFVNFQ